MCQNFTRRQSRRFKFPSVPLVFLSCHNKCSSSGFIISMDPMDFPINHEKQGIIQITPIQFKAMNHHSQLLIRLKHKNKGSTATADHRLIHITSS
jgi:hypothetical protein